MSAIPATASVLAAFDRWAADRMLAPRPAPVAVPEPETVEGRYEPTVAEAYYEAGFSLGRGGVLSTPEATLPDATPRDHLVGGLSFSEGQHDGFGEFARQAGYAAGLDGKTDAIPQSIPARFARAFERGHSSGIAERRMRGESLAEYYEELGREAMEAEYQRELEVLAREAGGWDRLVGREME